MTATTNITREQALCMLCYVEFTADNVQKVHAKASKAQRTRNLLQQRTQIANLGLEAEDPG